MIQFSAGFTLLFCFGAPSFIPMPLVSIVGLDLFVQVKEVHHITYLQIVMLFSVSILYLQAG